MAQINELTTLGRGSELLNLLATAEKHTAVLRGDLFGEAAQSVQPLPSAATCIDSMLAEAVTRMASLCGELITMRQRLGCAPDGPEIVPPVSGIRNAIYPAPVR